MIASPSSTDPSDISDNPEPMWKVVLVVLALALFAWMVWTVSIWVAVHMTEQPHVQHVDVEIGTACVIVRGGPLECE